MELLDELLKQAALSKKKIVLSEGSDPRVINAALVAVSKGIARIILVGSTEKIQYEFNKLHVEIPKDIEIYDPNDSEYFNVLSKLYFECRKHKGITNKQAEIETNKPYVFAALLVKNGLADGTVGGAVTTTVEIVKTAIQVIGTKPKVKLISSFFIMLFSQSYHQKKGVFLFSDCGLVVNPDAKEMALIAINSAKSYKDLFNDTPRIAMLSFSTNGSASHPCVTKVIKATEIVKTSDPNLLIDGELQFDTAFVPEIADIKLPNSTLKGNANIFIFPNLDAGNIAYKIAQRLGGAMAVGPILQGLSKPANDLSRGCSSQDILYMIAITVLQANCL